MKTYKLAEFKAWLYRKPLFLERAKMLHLQDTSDHGGFPGNLPEEFTLLDLLDFTKKRIFRTVWNWIREKGPEPEEQKLWDLFETLGVAWLGYSVPITGEGIKEFTMEVKRTLKAFLENIKTDNFTLAEANAKQIITWAKEDRFSRYPIDDTSVPGLVPEDTKELELALTSWLANNYQIQLVNTDSEIANIQQAYLEFYKRSRPETWARFEESNPSSLNIGNLINFLDSQKARAEEETKTKAQESLELKANTKQFLTKQIQLIRSTLAE
jgi:hypothetical protein